MNPKAIRTIIILVAVAIGYSLLSSPGPRFHLDVETLKSLLLYILLGAGAYAVWDTLRTKRPPGV